MTNYFEIPTEDEQDFDLSSEQIERQDFVDNTIYAMLEELLGKNLEWNIEQIGMVRDIVQKIAESEGISEEDFYPFMEME
ncbi:MAG: hypothetical protein WA061_01735 [Microgenomates group bacterium]